MRRSSERSQAVPRFAVAVLGLGLAAACATPPQVQQGRVDVPYLPTRVNLSASDSAALDLSNGGGAYVVPVSLDRAWASLPAAYKSLGLEVTQNDPGAHALAGQIVRTRRPFGGRGWNDLLDCGETAGVPNATRYDITMQAGTKLRAQGRDSTLVATWVLASAKPGSTAGYDTNCASKGEIPDVVARAVLQASQPR